MKGVIAIACMLMLLAGCGGEQTETEQTTTDTTEQLSAGEALLVEASDKLIGRFGGALKKELLASLSEHGPVEAISVCRDVAPAIADSFSVEGWSIRRVSALNRNLNNRATLEEKDILSRFASATDAPPYVGLWHEDDSVKAYRYYKPIFVQQLCLKCHGNLQTMAPGVYQAVKKHYPDDRATGYQVGDLRGMFVVEALWPEAEAHARTLVSGAEEIAPTP